MNSESLVLTPGQILPALGSERPPAPRTHFLHPKPLFPSYRSSVPWAWGFSHLPSLWFLFQMG